ncbi:hypothetical protein EVAR_17459_1 [Eumeta japonica]|uniref:Uncharacterized protein n=1 Tax=Eumeta variegata TaxID=151549 RepID=A0A4C1VAA3_EUMVA|nr:hypothetical protein EVAR_17459_1 [Eumeta japonica]
MVRSGLRLHYSTAVYGPAHGHIMETRLDLYIAARATQVAAGVQLRHMHQFRCNVHMAHLSAHMSCIHYNRERMVMHFVYFTQEHNMRSVHRLAVVPYRTPRFSRLGQVAASKARPKGRDPETQKAVRPSAHLLAPNQYVQELFVSVFTFGGFSSSIPRSHRSTNIIGGAGVKKLKLIVWNGGSMTSKLYQTTDRQRERERDRASDVHFDRTFRAHHDPDRDRDHELDYGLYADAVSDPRPYSIPTSIPILVAV